MDRVESFEFWSAGVLLYLGPDPPDKSHSVTSRTAYWARRINIMERREPVSICMQSVNDISSSVTKTTFLQAMYRHADKDIPISTEVDPDMLRPLVRGAPNMLKGYLVGRQDAIKRDVMHNEAL